jgi:MoaA/NifB/PqqE/SkfB family radical SAM enzyme
METSLDKELMRFLWERGLYRKLLNYVVTNVQYRRLSTFLWSYPYQIFIDPSSRCTLQCPFCAVGTRSYPKPMKDMPLKAFKRLMSELGPYLLVAELFIKGEPLMNKDIYEMIACCKSYRVFTRVSSNMQFLSKELAEKMVLSGLDHLLASVDGATQASYEAYRKGGDLELALANMRHVVEAKKRLGRTNPIVEWKFIVFSHNEAELDLARRMAAEIGVDRLCFVPAFVGDAPLNAEQEKWLPRAPEHRMYGNSGANLEKTVGSQAIAETCNLPWMSLSVDPLSNVQTCCRCNEPQHDHGRVKRAFWRVWNGKRFRDSRRYIREGRRVENDPTNLCSTCTAKSSLNAVLPFEFHKAL